MGRGRFPTCCNELQHYEPGPRLLAIRQQYRELPPYKRKIRMSGELPLINVIHKWFAFSLALASGALLTSALADTEKPFHRAETIFPLRAEHNHGSCIVELPNGDLLTCWYRGSGERKADDVAVLGARKRPGARGWSEPFVLADTPGFPDCNPCLIVDAKRRLQLFWPVIIANEWHTALLMSKVSERYSASGAPVWSRERPILLKPGSEFTRAVDASVTRDLARLSDFPADRREAIRGYLELRRKNGADRYFNRMGWMPRVHPLLLEGGRMLLPLYSDGFDFSLIAISDDGGETWHPSQPIVGEGPVQPSLVQRADGTLLAYMRDNGLPPQRVQVSESRDRGETWSTPRDDAQLNPGAGLEVIRLRNGHWLLVNNDTEKGRHSLAVSLSEDEGRTWRWVRHLLLDRTTVSPATGSYPSAIQAKDGTIHVTYTYTTRGGDEKKDAEGRALRECIQYEEFNEAWVRAGDPR